MVSIDRATSSRINGKKGGRPKQDSKIRIKLPETNFVILTPTQYDSLAEKYGYEIIMIAGDMPFRLATRSASYSNTEAVVQEDVSEFVPAKAVNPDAVQKTHR